MDDQELAKRVHVLRRVTIFSELRKPLLEELAQKVKFLEFDPDHNLINKGEQGNEMYIISRGQVRVHDGTYELAVLSDGECFGEYALIDPEVRNASITCITKVELYQLSQEDFYELVTANPGFVNAVLVVLIRRLRQLDVVQKSLADSYDEITRQKDKIETQNSQLSKLDEEKNHLMSIVAHDIRNPVTSSINIAEAMQAKFNPGQTGYKEYTERIIHSMRRIDEIAAKILLVKAEDKQPSAQELTTINLGRLLDNIHLDFSPRARKKEIGIKIEVADAHARLDQVKTRQLFENLLSNAIKFTPFGRMINIRVADMAGKAMVEIKDQGPGFTEADKGMLYTKFQRLSASPTDGESSLGLGLAIVKKYVEQMDGEIELESESGKGAKFVVSFSSVMPNS